MTMSNEIRDREFNKFKDAGSVEVVKTELFNDSGIAFSTTNPFPVFDVGVGDWDACAITYPSATQEVYTFSKTGTTVLTVTINYTDATKYRMSSITRV